MKIADLKLADQKEQRVVNGRPEKRRPRNEIGRSEMTDQKGRREKRPT